MQARIDSHNKILYARHADQRNATFQRVLQTGSEFDQDVRAMLLRANLLKHEYNVRAARKLWIGRSACLDSILPAVVYYYYWRRRVLRYFERRLVVHGWWNFVHFRVHCGDNCCCICWDLFGEFNYSFFFSSLSL